ncbi:hypothetical protein PRK78_003666 [Emydomyces testavorans]|uniref:Smr domain-containing protein n=1 Tax=Emydomyces testavorans TaxID=2070801 RepID=A0AAF0IIK3_9EURO|nr:hypothetical protein PRK78_003666 [Emydomyces testavorans]
MVERATINVLTELENEYCPPLDPALFAAIANDYSLDENPDSIDNLRATLNELKDFAADQENSDFDPSGTSGRGIFEDEGASEPSENSSHRTLQTLETNITSLESSLSSLSVKQDGLNRKHERPQIKAADTPRGINSLQKAGAFSISDLEGKQEYLKEMFPSIGQYTISHTLGKCDGDIDRCMDVLLNLAFFEENDHDYTDTDANGERISIPKGIEGFGEGLNQRRGRRKRKAKGKQSKTKQALEQSISTCAESDLNGNKDNKWDSGKRDVDFICSRTHLSAQAVSSAYHLNGANLPTTIHYLARKEIEKHPKDAMEDPVIVQQIAELREDFSTVAPTKLAGLLRLARNSISAANELAGVMVTEQEAPMIDIMTTNWTPPNSMDTEYTVRKTKTIGLPSSNRSNTAMNFTTRRTLAERHRRAGETAFNKAQAAYRRGKSDHLMGVAASYYSTIGREHVEIAKRETSAAADALVDSQSTGKVLDLHGVSVQDGVRIACERVEDWWESLGDTKYMPGGRGPVRDGYRIITGLGRHSRNGTAKLGPAVARTLANEGWRVEVGEGLLTVTGLVRKR